MRIYKATLEQAGEIASLFQDLAAAMAALQPRLFHAVEHEASSVERIIKSPDTDILLAGEGKKIFGFTLLRIKETPSYVSLVKYRYAHLIDIYVRPESRGKGVGAALVEAAKKWARDKELAFVELQVLPENPRAKALYERKDFVTAMHTLHCFL